MPRHLGRPTACGHRDGEQVIVLIFRNVAVAAGVQGEVGRAQRRGAQRLDEFRHRITVSDDQDRLAGVLRYVAEKGYETTPLFRMWNREHAREEVEYHQERKENSASGS